MAFAAGVIRRARSGRAACGGRGAVTALSLMMALFGVWALAPGSAVAGRRVPRSFFGVVPQAPPTAADYGRMAEAAGTIRVPIFWFAIERRQGEPDFRALDQVVGAATAAGLRVLPYVYGTPAWLADRPARPPLASKRGRRAWASFLARLVRRYGPGGAFWAGVPDPRPIRSWQIWNEPNFPLFWAKPVSAPGYARLLAIAARTIRTRDHGARIVLAGLAPVEDGPLPWVYLERLYRVGGVKKSFDVVGLHPYSATLGTLALQVRRARAAMAAAGDGRTPIEITEFGVSSGGELPGSIVSTPAGQAEYLGSAYELLLANRGRWRLVGADWYSWSDGVPDTHCVFCQHAGLFNLEDRPKPTWWAYREVARR